MKYSLDFVREIQDLKNWGSFFHDNEADIFIIGPVSGEFDTEAKIKTIKFTFLNLKGNYSGIYIDLDINSLMEWAKGKTFASDYGFTSQLESVLGISLNKKAVVSDFYANRP